MRYVSNQAISFSIRINGKENGVRVSFSPNTSGGSIFITENEALIEALEKSPMYNSVYRRAQEYVGTGNKPKIAYRKAAEKKLVQVGEVKCWQDAVEYLVSNCNSDSDKLIAPEAIINEAQAKGIEFPNLK